MRLSVPCVVGVYAASLFHFIYHQALHVVKDGHDHHLTQVLLTGRAVTVRWLDDGHFLTDLTENGPSWIVHVQDSLPPHTGID